jgi:phosphoserine aminotransferase
MSPNTPQASQERPTRLLRRSRFARRVVASSQAKRRLHASALLNARVLCSDPIDGAAVDILKARGHQVTTMDRTSMSKEELIATIGDYEALIVRSGTQVTGDVMDAASKLKVVGRAGTGVDNIDVPEATKRGIVVMNTPGANTVAAAELTMTLLLALTRNIPQAVESMKAGRWDRKHFMGSELAGKTIGLVGLGRIGQTVGRWCMAFGMRVIGFDPVLSAESAEKAGIEPVSLDAIWSRSDFISLHTPLTPDTRNLVNESTLAKCKAGVRIVNCARGGIINEVDLLEAVKSGHVAGAALDVFRSEPPPPESMELAQHPNIICTPHVGASTKEAQLAVAVDIARQISDALDGSRFVGVVNASNLEFASRPDLMPYVSLAERLGSLQAQLVPAATKVKELVVSMNGSKFLTPEVAEVVRVSALMGFLKARSPDEAVNAINAALLAEQLGLKTRAEVSTSASADYSNSIRVSLTSLDGSNAGVAAAPLDPTTAEVSGTVFNDREGRLVRVGGFSCDVVPSGHALLFNNKDRPGILKAITTELGESGVNIANFGLGRHNEGGEALGIITTDGAIPESTIERLRKLDSVWNVNTVRLPETVLPTRAAASSILDDKMAISGKSARRPSVRPGNPQFGSGPTTKRPGWSLSALVDAALGRSHRSALGKSKLKRAIDETRELLELPSDYLVGIVPGSDTGAYEMAMWSVLGARPVDVFHWESFGKGWLTDAKKHLKLPQVHEYSAPYGSIPDLSQANKDHDVCFTWNGTTSGVRVPHADWIAPDRTGITLVDATSAVFAQRLDWSKCDVTTYSWQKVLGGEGAHGMLILSPRAVERLESFVPDRAIPKVFRLTKGGKLMTEIFEGSTINTPSMLAVEDYLDSLAWARSQGGLDALVSRADENLAVVEQFVANHSWVDFLARDASVRSNTSVCLSVDLPADKIKKMVKLLEKENVAYDIGAYRDAPPGLRIWTGATVERSNLEALMPWLQWAFTVASTD